MTVGAFILMSYLARETYVSLWRMAMQKPESPTAKANLNATQKIELNQFRKKKKTVPRKSKH